MGWPQLALQIFLRFIFATPAADVITVASAPFALWLVAALVYVYLKPEPYPLFFGVPARQATWYTKPFPWKYIIVPAIVGGLFLFIAWPARAQDTKPGETKPGDDIAAAPVDLDKFIAPLVNDIIQFQSAYYGQRGTYAQVLPLYSNAPADGIATLPDKLSDIPTSGIRGSDLWSYVKLDAFAGNIRIDVYDGPNGKGFVVTIDARFNGQLYTSSTNYGPEAYRSNGWVVVSESDR